MGVSYSLQNHSTRLSTGAVQWHAILAEFVRLVCSSHLHHDHGCFQEKQKIMKSYPIAVIGGDGTGPEVVCEAL